ncbi:MAG TPA: Na/Pi cotransporter family protein [Anaerolineae bacterium]|nr:Na/Pi cotransporter family protein [Anaerolineae bacterium]
MVLNNSLEVSSILIGLLGGLALFLYGMEQMTDAMKNIAGGRMKASLARLTTNRFKAVFTGAFVTAVIQSSSVTTVLVVGFISAGLLSLAQGIGIILGADIGTTITAQIVAFKITRYALVLVAVGFGLKFTAKRKKIQQYGLMILGLGLIFFGMDLMSIATQPLRSYQPFIDLMRRMDEPLIGVLIGLIFTAIIQSSSAAIGIIIVLASQGFVSLEAGIALALGANIGTAVTAMLAAIGKPREAVQAAVAHLLFKIIGVLMWFWFIAQLASFARWLSPAAAPKLVGTARLAAEVPRQIANAHTVFNVVNTFTFIWFIDPFIKFLNLIIPERPAAVLLTAQPKYLDNHLLQTPKLALDRVRLELGRLGRYTLRMLHPSLRAVLQGGPDDLADLAKMDDDVDSLYGGIVTYLGRLSQGNLLKRDAEVLSDYMTVANYLESIGDLVQTNLVDVGHFKLAHQVTISPATTALFQHLHDRVVWSVEQALIALDTNDAGLAEQVMAAKGHINQLAVQAEEHLARRLIAEEPNRLDTFRMESEVVEYLRRVYYFAKRIAKVVADADLIYKQVDLEAMTLAQGLPVK